MNELTILKTTIKIGIKNPFKLLHITDSHIFRDDASGWNRKTCFDCRYDGCTEAFYHQAIKYAKEHNIAIFHTGDLIDFFSEGNFHFLQNYFPKNLDYIYAAGNHDFVDFADIQRGQEETEAYKKSQLKLIAPYIKNNLYFDAKLIGEVNVVTLDNSYYRISEGQLDALKAEVAKGYPIILGMHVPIYTLELAKACVKEANVCYLMNAPDELLNRYPANRKKQQAPDNITKEATAYIESEPQIKAVIAGHLHQNHETKLRGEKMQYVTHGSFAGFVREITII